MQTLDKSKQSVEFGIDWLTITKPSLELSGENEVAMTMYDFDGTEKWESNPAPRPYKHGVKNAIGALGGTARKPQGTILQWSGSALKQKNAMDLIGLVFLNDWRITRLDICVDFLGFPTTVEDYKLEFVNGQCNTESRKWSEQTSDNGGHTFYIGSWKSDRFMRVYNKRAEQARFKDSRELPELWTRCELRLGGEHAIYAARVLQGFGEKSAIPSLLRAYADFINVPEYRNMTDYPITTYGKGKVQTNTKKWIVESILPVMCREFALDPEFGRDCIEYLLKSINN